MRQFKAKILINASIAPNLMHLAFRWPHDLASPNPGQFFTVLPPMVEIGAGTLLRRPLAFAGFERGGEERTRGFEKNPGSAENLVGADVHNHGAADLAGGNINSRGAADLAGGNINNRDAADLAGGNINNRGATNRAGATAHSIYQIRGAGTKALSMLRPGTSISIIGPLGNSFPEPAQNETALVAGGGIGIGPMLFLAAWLRAKKLPYRFVAGFRSMSMVPLRAHAWFADSATTLPPADAVEPHGATTARGMALMWRQLLEGATIATDDGSLGIKGTVLDALAHLDAAAPSSERWHLYGCGPSPMLAALARFAPARRAAAHFSAEQWMACGVGACHGCVIPAAAGGYLRVCADGPVFSAEAIDWEIAAL